MSKTQEQKQILKAIEKWNFRKNWSNDEFLAVLLIRMAEKLGKAVNNYDKRMPVEMVMDMGVMEWKAKRLYDNYHQFAADMRRLNIPIQPNELARLKEELIDLQVVLCCAAEALGEMMEEEIDLMQGAIEKAESGIGRGVRKTSFHPHPTLPLKGRGKKREGN